MFARFRTRLLYVHFNRRALRFGSRGLPPFVTHFQPQRLRSARRSGKLQKIASIWKPCRD
jgi:hypothetical protein